MQKKLYVVQLVPDKVMILYICTKEIAMLLTEI